MDETIEERILNYHRAKYEEVEAIREVRPNAFVVRHPDATTTLWFDRREVCPQSRLLQATRAYRYDDQGAMCVKDLKGNDRDLVFAF